jgi:hypothetical protein
MTGHRLSTDRVDGTIIAKCPNKEHEDDGHLEIHADYEDCADNTLLEELLDAFPDCGECGTALDWIRHEEPSEVLD